MSKKDGSNEEENVDIAKRGLLGGTAKLAALAGTGTLAGVTGTSLLGSTDAQAVIRGMAHNVVTIDFSMIRST